MQNIVLHLETLKDLCTPFSLSALINYSLRIHDQ